MRYISIIIFLFTTGILYAQQTDHTEDIIEKYTENTETSADYSQIQEELDAYLSKPVNLNTASMEELMRFPLLSPAGAVAIIGHRNSYGPLIHISELQVVGFSAEEIQLLAPFVTVEKDMKMQLHDLGTALRKGDFLWVNTAKIKSPNTLPDSVLGDPLNYSMRFRYSKPGIYSTGFSVDKDAGERWWHKGPDFFSGHFFVQNMGCIKSFAVGDYLLGFGQGLVMGSGIGMGKSSLVLQTKRNVPELKPYRGVNEFLFLRGAAMAFAFRRMEFTVAGSVNQLDTRILTDTGIFFGGISSTDLDGWHRTRAEFAAKGNSRRAMAGAWAKYNSKRGYLGGGYTGFHNNRPLSLSDDLYRTFLPSGKHQNFFHVFQAHTIHRFHIFSEWAWLQENRSKSAIAGLLTSLGKSAEASLVWRHYDPGFYSPFSTAFGNGNQNEQGIYAGIKIRFSPKVSLSHYTDIWQHPWLNYRIWAPSRGRDLLWQIDLIPVKKSTLYFRFRSVNKPYPFNEAEPSKLVVQQKVSHFRMHLSSPLSKSLTIQMRGETSVSDISGNIQKSSLAFFQFTRKSGNTRVSMRYTVFDVPFYFNRLYAFESQLQYDFGTAAYYGRGYSVYLLVQEKLNRYCQLGIRGSMKNEVKPDEFAAKTSYAIFVQLVMHR